MPETPIYSWDTPAYGDEPDGPAALATLAGQIETTVKAGADALTAEIADRAADEAALAALTTTSSAAAVAANWTMTSCTARKIDALKLCMIEGTFARTTSIITVDANGNCTNTLVCTLNTGFRPISRMPITFLYASNSSMCHGMIEPTGTITIMSGLPNTDVPIGGGLVFGAVFLTA